MKNINLFTLFLLSVIISCTSSHNNTKIKFIGETQGTYYAITYFASDTLIAQVQVDSLLADFDMIASIWEPNSLVSKINRNETDEANNLHFEEMFNISQKISAETEGSFDITVGPLVNAWGFGFKNKQDLTKEMVDSIMQFVGYRNVRLENGKIIKDHPNIQIDLNAIAPGYAVDILGKYFESKGIKVYLIDIGGEIITKGLKPNGEKWIVGIEKPSEEATSGRILKAKVKVADIGLTTSGNYRKFYIKDGVKYSHTINPHTGYPVTHCLLSATVFASNAAFADGYATAFMVMGLEKTKLFLEKNKNLGAYLIYTDEAGNLRTFTTPDVEKMLNEL